MIFVESEIDKRGKLYKAVKDKEGSWNSDGRMRRQFFGGLRGV